MKRNATSTTGLSHASAGADTSVGRGCPLLSRRNATGPLTHRMSHHRPGSALILVLVCLVMMVLIGTAYIQVARVDRRATAQLTGVNNLDTVRDAVIAYMAKVLKEDIFDDAGKMFNPASFDEPYDHAWTNRNVTFQVQSRLPATMGNVIGNAAGGQNDDTWLAATYTSPEVPTNGLHSIWNKFSNLNGIYLVMPKTPGGTLPKEWVVEPNQNYDSRATDGGIRYDGYGEVFVNISAYGDNDKNSLYSNPIGGPGQNYAVDYNNHASWQPVGVDADGDGLLDSAWTWAPEEVHQIGALTYVVAYRIIDLSSLANINIATALTGNGSTNPTITQAARGAYPTDLDLSRLFAKSNKGANWTTEFGAVMTTRGLSTTFPTLPGVANFSATTGLATFAGAGHRAAAWNDTSIGAKFYGYPNNRYDMESELELRAFGGLNTTMAASIESSMPGLLRNGPKENTIQNVPGLANGGTDGAYNSYMNGSIRGLNAGYSLGHAERTYPALRHVITTTSGASVLAPQYTADWTQGASSLDRLQYDLVHRHVAPTSNPTARVQEIKDRLKKIFSIGDPLYLGLSAAQKNTVVDQIATEFAVNIVDYSDPDNEPTGLLAADGKTYYGLEIMPFLREFYVQAAYESTMPDTTAMPPVYKERTLVPGSGAFVIEIGNPFDKNCSFAGASIRVRIIKEGSTTALVQYDVPQTVNELPPRDNNEIAEQLIFYSTPAVPTADGLGKGGDLLADLSLNTAYAAASRRVEIPAKLPDSAFDESPLTVELQVEVSEGVFITYDRLRAPEMKLPNKYTQDHGDATTPEKGHSQISLMRDGQKNRYLSNRGRVVRKSDAGLNTYVGNASTVSMLGKDNKGVAGDANLDKIQLAHSNHQIFNVAELGYIFMYGFFHGDEGDLPSRISGKNGDKVIGTTTEATETPGNLGRMFLSLNKSGATVDASNPAIIPNTTKLPHFSMVMDQFTTLSPRWDGVDNDNDGGFDNTDAEQFVPGRMNVNTTPTWLLAMMSPLPETLGDLEQYYQAIGEYRDRPDSRPTITGIASGLPVIRNSDKGIRSIGELLLIRRRIASTSDNQKTFRYGEDAAVLPDTDPKRHYPHVDDNTASVYDEEYTAQERMARFQYLSNTLTTRSDRFCAYVVIRGYGSTAFQAGPVESLRFFVLLDRSGLIDVDSTVVAYPRTGQKN